MRRGIGGDHMRREGLGETICVVGFGGDPMCGELMEKSNLILIIN